MTTLMITAKELSTYLLIEYHVTMTLYEHIYTSFTMQNSKAAISAPSGYTAIRHIWHFGTYFDKRNCYIYFYYILYACLYSFSFAMVSPTGFTLKVFNEVTCFFLCY
jgi:hypothetical protein